MADQLATVDESSDPVTDSFRLAMAYREAAHSAPHLYAVMFGGSTIAGFELSDEDRRTGRYTLQVARDAVARCIQAGRFRTAEPWSVARHWWCQIHGLVSLELAGYLATTHNEDEFHRHLRDFAIGAGDSFDQAQASLTAAGGSISGVRSRA
ncbi:MAG TPA: TetR-like C-terminal domain-containing protein [Micromonosporaceae bacterium]|nr:TetR-like C-terminal domain-containing protein [Micromonosporaceae bacterium]